MEINITIKNEGKKNEKKLSFGMLKKIKRKENVLKVKKRKARFFSDDISDEGRKARIFSDEISDEERQRMAKRIVEKKIKHIPEGKKFTLKEYFDYTEEFKWDGYTDWEFGNDFVARDFLNIIRYPSCRISKYAFADAVDLDKLYCANLANRVIENNAVDKNRKLEFSFYFYYDDVDEEFIIKCLKKSFNKWLEERQDIRKYCTNASLINLIRYFKSKVLEFSQEVDDEE